MEYDAYIKMSEVEERLWWYVARRKILQSIIEQMPLPEMARILEVGCGTGGNLDFLSSFGSITATESNATAMSIARKKTNSTYDIRLGECPDGIPSFNHQFDLICMFDVLEHIDDDIATLSVLRKLLAPGGLIMITVPAYQWLWSSHDEYLHHKRRYSKTLLRKHAAESGLKFKRASYFNTILFPMAVLARLNSRKKVTENMSVPSAPINQILQSIFGFERMLLKITNLPFGVSLLALMEPV